MKVVAITPDSQGVVSWPLLSASRKSVVTLGSFDGVHQGHVEVLRTTVRLARQLNALSVAIIMDPRPSVVHAQRDLLTLTAEPAYDPHAVSSVYQRLRVLNDLDLDYAIVVRYTPEFAQKSYRFFLGQMVGKLGMRTLVLGADAAIGANRAGTLEALQTFSQACGLFEVVPVHDAADSTVWVPQAPWQPKFDEQGMPVDPTAGMTKAQLRAWSKAQHSSQHRLFSSTNIRYLLAQGRVAEANTILGRYHGLEGLVVHGEQVGRTLGFPTANLADPVQGLVPADGVYAGWLIDLGEAETMPSAWDFTQMSTLHHGDEARLAEHSAWRIPAAISIGSKPTFHEDGQCARTVEAYGITDQWLELYGHRVRLELVEFLHAQERFADVDELTARLHAYAQDSLRIVQGHAL